MAASVHTTTENSKRSALMTETILELGFDLEALTDEQEAIVRRKARKKIDADPGYRGGFWQFQKYETHLN